MNRGLIVKGLIVKSVLFLFFLIVFKGISFGTIVGSQHDFSAQGWGTTEICVPCHTPHNADTSVTDAPLWNHEVTTAIFTLYASPTMDETPEQPRGPSKLCLSCHDGIVALDSFGGTAGSTTIGGDANLGTNLSDDHPVSVLWSHSELSDCTTKCHTPRAGDIPDETWEVPFFDGYVECASCHDVHNTADHDHLLVKDNASSALCQTCHQK